MIQTYKILKDIERIDSNAFFTQAKYKRTRSYLSLNLKQSLENMHLVKGS